LTPEYILNNWTDEELELMVEKLSKRKQREAKTYSGETEDTEVSIDQMVNDLGIQHIKKED
jgi:hypothetical protein